MFVVTGQFAEVAYSGRIISLHFVLRNIETLLEPNFLLDGYTALRGAVMVSYFKGRVAELPGYVVYRNTQLSECRVHRRSSSLSTMYGHCNVDTPPVEAKFTPAFGVFMRV
jgi:hypothetical protein